MSFQIVSNHSSNYQRLEQNEIWLNLFRFSWRKVPFAVYIISRLALIQLNEAEFTDGYQLLTWSFDHPIRWHPLYPLLIKPFAWIMDPVIAGRLVSIASGLLAMFLLTRIAAEVYGERAALTVAWLYTASPLFYWCNIRVLTESTFQLLFCYSILLLIGSFRRVKPVAPGLFVFVSGLAGLTRPEGFVLLPVAVFLSVRQVVRNRTKGSLAFSLVAFTSWVLCLGWSFATSSSDSYSDIFLASMADFEWGHAFQRLTSYIEVYPYIMFYPVFMYAVLNLVLKRGFSPVSVAWKYILFYIHLVFAMMLFLHPSWTTRFLLIPISLLLVEAAAALSVSRLAVKTIVIVSCFAFSLLAIDWQKEMFLDFKESAIAIRKVSGDHRVISDEQAKTEYYLGKPVIEYKPNVVLRSGDLLLLHSYNTDLSQEKETLDARYAYRALLSTEASIIPLLSNTAVAESDYSNSPVALLQRFHRHRFQSVVLIIDHPKKNQAVKH